MTDGFPRSRSRLACELAEKKKHPLENSNKDSDFTIFFTLFSTHFVSMNKLTYSDYDFEAKRKTSTIVLKCLFRQCDRLKEDESWEERVKSVMSKYLYDITCLY